MRLNLENDMTLLFVHFTKINKYNKKERETSWTKRISTF